MPPSTTVAIATYGARIASVSLPPPRTDLLYLVIWQMPDQLDVPHHLVREDVQVYGMRSRGLSRSRNAALALVETKVCILMDDDVFLDADGVVNASADLLNSDSDVAVCNILYGPHKEVMHKRSPSFLIEENLGWVASCEIALRMDTIRKSGLGFHPDFGTGSGVYPMGEENIFLHHLRESGARFICFDHIFGWHPDVSSGSREFDLQALLGRQRVDATLRPWPPSWLRRLRSACSSSKLSWKDRCSLVFTRTPAVRPYLLVEKYDHTGVERLS